MLCCLYGYKYVNRYMLFFFFKQKTAYEISECDWSSDVCSSDLHSSSRRAMGAARRPPAPVSRGATAAIAALATVALSEGLDTPRSRSTSTVSRPAVAVAATSGEGGGH